MKRRLDFKIAGRGIAGTVVVVAGLALAPPALAGDLEVVKDPGFEKTKCGDTVDSCTNANWVDTSSFFSLCLESACGGQAKSGKGFVLFGGKSLNSGQDSSGYVDQTVTIYEDWPATVSFDLKSPAAVPGMNENFTVDFTSGSGGAGGALYETSPSAMSTGYEHVSLEAQPAASLDEFFAGVHCSNGSGATATCPAYQLDNLSIVYHLPAIKLTKSPKKKTTSKHATFAFKTDMDFPTSFECSLDGKAFEGCLSPRIYDVKPGKHVFKIRSAGGNEPPLPATYSWKVVKR